jgi:hypothetical protein
MPLELQVIRASEFVCLDPDEHLNFEESKKTLQTLAQACKKRGLDRALLDLRALQIPAKPLFTPTQLAALIGTFREAGFGRQQKLAVLYKADPHGGVRTFAFIGRIQGWQVRAFDEFEAAFHWLSEESIRNAEHRESAVSVPITKRQGEVKKLPIGITAGSSGTRAARPVRRITSKQ